MDRVENAVERYLTHWHDTYTRVGDVDIVVWQVRNVMHDIEYWIDDQDPNGARDDAGFADWTRTEFISLYRQLAASASFYGLRPNPEYTV